VAKVADPAIIDAVFAPVDDLVVTSRHGKPTSVWHARTRSTIAELKTRASESVAAFSRDGSLLALASNARTQVWDTESWKPLVSVRGLFADFSKDNRFVLTETRDGGAHVWEAESGEHILTLTWPELLQNPIFGNDSRSIIAIGNDGVVRTFRCATCRDADDLLAPAERRITTVR
jgi:WD40 repeat protein